MVGSCIIGVILIFVVKLDYQRHKSDDSELKISFLDRLGFV
jgi:hypothetical protein